MGVPVCVCVFPSWLPFRAEMNWWIQETHTRNTRTVDGQHPAPLGRWFIPPKKYSIGFQPFQLVRPSTVWEVGTVVNRLAKRKQTFQVGLGNASNALTGNRPRQN